ncbi:ABC transporter permease subunit [Halovenus salina]|uniref:Branched-chain amino acid ABC transporter permease n=1 Tax=Halovenus salina TaxID=1510225 RepID=A0ABD5VY34_9EURY
MSTTESGLLPAWVGQYLRDHTVHIVVVALFILYPFAYDVLVGQFGLIAETLLLRPRTMLTVLWLGLFAMSFDFVSGYTGYLSFGHAAFFGIGAYFVVLGYNGQLPLLPAELPFMSLLVLGALVAVVAAVLIGLIAFRLSGVYFAMITLGVSEILFVASENFDFITPGGSDPADGITPGHHRTSRRSIRSLGFPSSTRYRSNSARLAIRPSSASTWHRYSARRARPSSSPISLSARSCWSRIWRCNASSTRRLVA